MELDPGLKAPFKHGGNTCHAAVVKQENELRCSAISEA